MEKCRGLTSARVLDLSSMHGWLQKTILVNDPHDGNVTEVKVTVKNKQGDKEILCGSANVPHYEDEARSRVFIRSIQYIKNNGRGQ